ncbi:hypothetical protein FRC06_007453, partial [Ceratobasidium sp. 370]
MQPFLQHPSAQLPVVGTRQDAQANQNESRGNKLSVADSLVLLQSLKQSRSIWLTKAFLRFSTRSKNKVDQVHPAPPPHSLSLAGSCDLEIGPHLFPQTNIYFVQYQYTHTPTPAPAPVPVPKPVQAPVPAPAPAATQPVAPITVSHELHAKVLAAAAKDPELQTILQLAAQGRANVAQLRVLGTTIKALEAGTYPNVSAAGTQPAASAPTASTSRQPAAVPVTQSAPSAVPRPTPAPVPTTPAIPTTAILLEFAERPIDRWLLPSEYVLLDKAPNGDVLLSTFYPFDAYVPSGGVGPNGTTVRSKPAHPLTIRFVAAPTGVWTALSRTCTTVSPSSAQGVLAEVITNVPARTYLQYRIAPGPLWEDLKAKNPGAKSVLLPSTTPKPLATTGHGRRADDSAGGGATKRRKTNAGDSTGTTTPAETGGAGAKSKGKGKEKEKGATPIGTKRPASTQPTPAVLASTSNAPPATTPGQQSQSANLSSATPNAQTLATLAPANVPPNMPASVVSTALPAKTASPSLSITAVGTSATYAANPAKTPHVPSTVATPETSAIPTT